MDVFMFHPTLPETLTAPAVVTQEAFDLVWSQPQLPHRPEGWLRWPPDHDLVEGAAALAAALATEDPPRALAASLGVTREEATGILDRLIPTEPVPPPLTGSGSGRDAWSNYAFSIGVDVSAGDKKADIVAKVQAHNAKEQ